jgi:hypothetical protein
MVPQNPATKQASKQSAHPFYVAIEVFCERKQKQSRKNPSKKKSKQNRKEKVRAWLSKNHVWCH